MTPPGASEVLRGCAARVKDSLPGETGREYGLRRQRDAMEELALRNAREADRLEGRLAGLRDEVRRRTRALAEAGYDREASALKGLDDLFREPSGAASGTAGTFVYDIPDDPSGGEEPEEEPEEPEDGDEPDASPRVRVLLSQVEHRADMLARGEPGRTAASKLLSCLEEFHHAVGLRFGDGARAADPPDALRRDGDEVHVVVTDASTSQRHAVEFVEIETPDGRSLGGFERIEDGDLTRIVIPLSPAEPCGCHDPGGSDSEGSNEPGRPYSCFSYGGSE